MDRENGLDHPGVVNLDNVTTVPRELLGARIGMLHLDQEQTCSMLYGRPTGSF